MKRKLLIFALFFAIPALSLARKQMTEQQAWAWYERVGVIKGFNSPYRSWPKQTDEQILRKAKSLGFNSVRFWVSGGKLSDQINRIRRMANTAEQLDMTISPVLAHSLDLFRRAKHEGKPFPTDECEQWIRQLVRPFAHDRRIVFWDIWNEPRYEDSDETRQQMDILEQIVGWLQAEDVEQPITSSIFWATINPKNKVLERTTEVESLMDIHNFHSYDCALDFGKRTYETLEYLKKISDRPIVCTECLTRTNGSGMERSLSIFAQYKVGFYIWGMYSNDRNWEARWDRSTYDPYEPMFHNVLYADGDLYDAREIEFLRNYRFVNEGETIDPGLEKTDRWSHERAWRWVVTGPVKGLVKAENPADAAANGYNCVQLKLEFSAWKADKDAFFKHMEELLKQAHEAGLTVMPVLLTDADAANPEQELAEFVSQVIKKYYADPRIKAWDLYHHPCETQSDTARVSRLVTTLFRYARNQYANQPLTMTPLVDVPTFAEGFDPWKAMVHGRTAGWDRLAYPNHSTVELVYKIWCLSDVISFSTAMKTPETGWLLSICYRFGRPIFCTEWTPRSADDIDSTLKRFAMSHVFWFVSQDIPAQKVRSFAFEPISTRRQYTEGM